MPSVLDEYKASKGIVFEEKKENNKNTGNKNSTHSNGLKRTHQIQDIVNKPR